MSNKDQVPQFPFNILDEAIKSQFKQKDITKKCIEQINDWKKKSQEKWNELSKEDGDNSDIMDKVIFYIFFLFF